MRCAASAAIASSSPPTPSPCSTRPPSAPMRDIDRLATAALREAARRKRKLVERDAVARVIDAEDRDAGRDCTRRSMVITAVSRPRR